VDAVANKILVVDDSITILELVAEALEPEGFVTLQALDGHDALAKLAVHDDIALVMSDVNMPRMSGLELLDVARQRGFEVPFVMLTTEAHPELVERARSMGVKGWLVKPVSPRTLTSTVKALAQRGSSGPGKTPLPSGEPSPAGRPGRAHST
jgi:two-component system chemotaxis response regulator CheY